MRQVVEKHAFLEEGQAGGQRASLPLVASSSQPPRLPAAVPLPFHALMPVLFQGHMLCVEFTGWEKGSSREGHERERTAYEVGITE